MIALREYARVVDKQLNIKIPEGFDYDEVEVLIFPKDNSQESLATDSIGKIGYSSRTFTADDEDYSKW